MLSTTTTLSTHPLLPDSFKKLVSSQAPGKNLAVCMMNIPPQLNGEESEIATAWLTADETIQLSHYSFEKRRNEWLAGRICAKQATINLLGTTAGNGSLTGSDFAISAGQSGRPYISIAGTTEPFETIDISISHSHGLAAGLAGYGLCGLDIQQLTTTLFKVKHRFCADMESAILDTIPADELSQLGLLWVAKEAVRKCLSGFRIVGFRELKLKEVTERQGGYFLDFDPELTGLKTGDSQPVTVIAHTDQSFAIAICTLDKEKFYAGTA